MIVNIRFESPHSTAAADQVKKAATNFAKHVGQDLEITFGDIHGPITIFPVSRDGKVGLERSPQFTHHENKNQPCPA